MIQYHFRTIKSKVTRFASRVKLIKEIKSPIFSLGVTSSLGKHCHGMFYKFATTERSFQN